MCLLFFKRSCPNYFDDLQLARRQSLEKKKTVNMPPMAMFHHNQFPAIPFLATSSVTARGVSAAKVVATMAVPAIYQGIFRPDKKNSLVLSPALRV